MIDQYREAAEIILSAKNLVALTGAGISVESGIPPFRGKGGLWEKIDPEKYAHIDTFMKDPVTVWNVLLKDYPAGNGYQNLVYYMQSMENVDQWLRYDFGAIKNMDKYGQIKPPAVPVDQLNVPTGLFIGTQDKLATVADNQWLETQLSEGILVWNQTYELDHLSFSMARDMSFFTNDVMNLVNKYATNSFATSGEPTLISTN